MSETEAYEGWAIVELMGHRKMAGRVSEQVVAGAAFLRVDVVDEAGAQLATQFYAPAAVYCITPTTEDLAKRMARRYEPEPVSRWELPERTASQPMAYAGVDEEEPTGRQCGCTEMSACPGGCSWVEADLCSRCAAQGAPA